MKNKEKNSALKRILEGTLITVVGGVIVFTITTGQIPQIIYNLVKNIDERNGFVVNDWYYSCDGQTQVYQPNEPQYSVRVVFVGPDVCGWNVHLMIPESSFGIELSNNYEESVDFTVTQGLYELQVFSNDGQMQTVYHATLEITKSDTYEVFLNEPPEVV